MALSDVVAAERWCEENVEHGKWFRTADRFFFEELEHLTLFKMTWL